LITTNIPKGDRRMTKADFIAGVAGEVFTRMHLATGAHKHLAS